MSGFVSRTVRSAFLLLTCVALGSCGLPRSGPSKAEIFAGAVQDQGNAHVVAVNDKVTRAVSVVPTIGFPAAFRDAGPAGTDVIRPGDVLGLRIWENVEDGLLAGAGQAATALNEVQVDDQGYIFVPYAGRLKAAGASPDGLRALITRKLAEQTPDPQVQVVRMPGNATSVTVLGDVAGPGTYPVERPTRRLTGIIAAAGGVAVSAETARVTLRRGGHSGHAWLTDIYSDARLDVAVRPGDVVVVEEDLRSFVALGATGGQRRVTFDSQSLSALDAIAQVGGLSSQLADPSGLFILRNEAADLANLVLGRGDLAGPQRLIYVIDLTAPNGLFLARDFPIRDGDTIYVTEAPYVRWQKALQVLTGSVGAANSVNGLADN